MIEAELKARVKDIETVRAWLQARAKEERATYNDTYYDWPDHRLNTEGREIRVRTITTTDGKIDLLTYKRPPVEIKSGSKPEFESTITDPMVVKFMLEDLGLIELVRITKYCQNYSFHYDGRLVIATLVVVPELNGTFIEVETQADPDELGPALEVVQSVMVDLAVIDDLESAAYTESVIQART
ncbi:class IV adenylate cyclase [Glycomyces dulcitolivorans]|uniref:class IV adenylate cyclase n=1 Tax=Glycomyces dulcitolivorans TaxID=2200759 RepID=UPI000DD2C37B|nr:class IV adenylate cyclase [Glycomyces dulcitolivorans]